MVRAASRAALQRSRTPYYAISTPLLRKSQYPLELGATEIVFDISMIFDVFLIVDGEHYAVVLSITTGDHIGESTRK